MTNANTNAATLPTTLEGTVFNPRTFTSNGKEYVSFRLAVYAGKHKDGSYKRGPSVDVTLVGEASSLGLPTEKSRVRVEGFLGEKEFKKRDGTMEKGLSLTALKATALEMRQKAPSSAADQPPPDYAPDYADVDF